MGLNKLVSLAWKCVFLAAIALPSHAQVVTATLTGSVNDSSGAVVPDATVLATETSTGVARTTTTSAEGVYTLPFLPPGNYRIDIQKTGFKTVTQILQLDVSSVGRVNATLSPGSQTETVQVTAEAPLLQVESAEVAKNFDSAAAAELPMPDRSAQAMAGLMAGVNVPALYSSGSGILENGAFTYMFNANGQVLGANNTMVDGIDNMDMALGLTLYQPATEDVSEVHVTTNAYSAEFGKVGGAVVNIVTKGGTNQFHGTLFEFNKTAALGARNVFNQAPQPKAGLTNNDYGVAGGGPIKRNKTFFFASWEGRKYYSRSQTTTTTAQPAWLNGDFSAVPGLQLYDPNTGNQSTGAGRSPFPNNIIPANEISPISKKLLQYIPAPNLVVAGAAAFTQNYIYSAPTDYNSNSVDGRIDHNFDDRHKLTVKFDTLLTHTYEGTLYTGTGAGNDLVSDGYTATGAIDYTWLMRSNTVVETRLNVNRWVASVKCTDTVTNAQLGIYDPNPDNISTQSLASITGIGIGGFGQGYQCPTIDHDTVFPFSNTWTKSFGKHSLKWGGDFVRYRNDRFQVQGSGGFGGRGTFSFNSNVTQNYLGSAGGSPLGLYGTTVNPFASFLLGLPASIDRAQILLSPTMRQSHADGFIQDSYKITPKLTLDIGLRYDWYEAVKVRYAGGASNYDPSTNSLLIAGYGNIGLSDGVTSKPGYLGPRLGLAYSLGAKTVIRAGYGISYWEQRFGWTGGTLNQQYPVIYNVQVGTTSQYVPAGTLASIVPVTYLAVPNNGILNPAPNQSFYTMPTHYNLPAVYTWNFTVQRQITSSFVIDAGWVANLGRELPYAYNINQGLPGAGPNAAILNLEYGRTASTTIRAYGAVSNYNSLQINATKKFGRGYYVALAYTFSKSLDETAENGGFLNPYNWKQSWGPSSFDQAHMLTISHVYSLPFGKGQPLLNSNRIASAILGGWQVSGIFRYLTGLPFTASASATNANCASCSVVPDIVGTPIYPGLYGPGELYLSSSAFALERPGTRGDSGRDNLRGPGMTVYDANLVRRFLIKERVTTEIRFEGTNITNHPHWGNPSATVGNATFGQITTATNPRQAQIAARVTF